MRKWLKINAFDGCKNEKSYKKKKIQKGFWYAISTVQPVIKKWQLREDMKDKSCKTKNHSQNPQNATILSDAIWVSLWHMKLMVP